MYLIINKQKILRLVGVALLLAGTAIGLFAFRSHVGTRAAGRQNPGSVAVRKGAVEEGVEIPVLMYHSIMENPRMSRYIISTEALEADLKFLKENGYHTVVMQDIIDYVYKGKRLPEKPIVLSFDDGHYNNLSYVQPLLKEYGFRGVIAVVGVFTDKFTEADDSNPRYSHLTWNQIKEMAEEGVFEIENHSWDMHTNSGGKNGSKRMWGESQEDYSCRLTEDLMRLQDRLCEVTGRAPNTFVFPFGAVSDGQQEILKGMGFLASLSCEEGVSRVCQGDPDCLFLMKRCIRSPKVSAEGILS